MSFEPDDYLARHFKTSGADLAAKVDELANLVVPSNSANLPLYREMLITVMRMAQADRSRWDAKILLQTMREMEAAFARLEQFKRRRKVTVFGSARTPIEHPLYAQARQLGATLATTLELFEPCEGGFHPALVREQLTRSVCSNQGYRQLLARGATLRYDFKEYESNRSITSERFETADCTGE